MKRTPKAPLQRSERNKGKSKYQVSTLILQNTINKWEYFLIVATI